MNIILVGTTAVHHTLVAAHLYLHTITEPDFGKLEHYCDMSFDYKGYPLYIGRDKDDNRVYTLGLGRLLEVGCRAIDDFRQIMEIDSSQLLVKAIRIPGELDIWAASKASLIPLGLGSIINRLVTDRVIAREFAVILNKSAELRAEVSCLERVSGTQDRVLLTANA